jgi:hypothetical protein
VSKRDDASTSWPSSSGLRGRRRTYLTILELADHALFKMVMHVLLPSLRPQRWPRKKQKYKIGLFLNYFKNDIDKLKASKVSIS